MVLDIAWKWGKSMFQTLRKQLTLLYALTTGIILTIVTIGVIASFSKEVKTKNLESFQTNLYAVENKILTDSVIKHSWLSEYENKSNLLIYIQDNGKPLDYQGYGYQSGLREELVEKMKKLAKEDNINIELPPISENKVISDVYSLQDSEQTKYLGVVDIIKTKQGYRSIILLQYFPTEYSSLNNDAMMFGIYALGIVALYFISWKFVGKSLKPIEENRKRQTEFIAAASHELRAPLAVIKTSASALKYEGGQENFIENIDYECVRMAKLIDDMLLLASTDAKNWSIHKKVFDADTLLIDTYELLEIFCKEKGYELTIDLPKNPLPKIEGDKERLGQVLNILIDNAVSYANALNKRILLKSYEKKNDILIQVIDFGQGIEEEKKAYIFDRFYRGDEARSEKNHFGLGLSIAKEIVELHEGVLTMEDTPSGGSTFTIKLKKVNG